MASPSGNNLAVMGAFFFARAMTLSRRLMLGSSVKVTLEVTARRSIVRSMPMAIPTRQAYTMKKTFIRSTNRMMTSQMTYMGRLFI